MAHNSWPADMLTAEERDQVATAERAAELFAIHRHKYETARECWRDCYALARGLAALRENEHRNRAFAQIGMQWRAQQDFGRVEGPAPWRVNR